VQIKTPLPPSAFEVDTHAEESMTAPSGKPGATDTMRIWVGDASRTLTGGTAWAAAAGGSALVTIALLLLPGAMHEAPARAAQVTDGIVHLDGSELTTNCGVSARPARAKLDLSVDTAGRVRRAAARGLGGAEAQCVERLAAGWDFLPQAQAVNLELDISVD
jgi:hypothetical protein